MRCGALSSPGPLASTFIGNHENQTSMGGTTDLLDWVNSSWASGLLMSADCHPQILSKRNAPISGLLGIEVEKMAYGHTGLLKEKALSPK